VVLGDVQIIWEVNEPQKLHLDNKDMKNTGVHVCAKTVFNLHRK
jgi:hypothetical protein